MEVAVFRSSIPIPSHPQPPPRPHHRRHRHRPNILNPPLSKPCELSPSSKSSSATAAAPAAPSRPPLLTAISSDVASHLRYYANLASKLAGDGRIEHFLMIAESLIAWGLDPPEFISLLDAELVSVGICRLIRLREKNGGIAEVFSSLQKLGISPLALFDGLGQESLARECRRLVDSDDVHEAVNLMEVLLGFGFPVKDLVKPVRIIKSCVDKRDPDIVVRYAHILPHSHVVLCTIIHEFGKQKDLLSALKAFEASKKNLSHPNMYAYRMIIDVCGLCGDYERSRDIYEELLAQNFIPNVFVFNSLMNANAHDLSFAFHVYRHMKNLGVKPDVASYNILLKACSLAGRVDLAQNIYCEVRELESTGGLKLDVFTYSTIMKVLADAKMWQLALKIKEDMIFAGVTPNIVTWSSLISACANAGLVELAVQLFKEMILSGCEPNSQCCNILLHACVEARQYDRAFRIFQSWKTGGLKEAVSNNCEGNRVPKSYYPFTPTTSTYNTLMKACGTNYYRAVALVSEMKTMGLSPDHVSWSILINICGGSGNMECAIQILKIMQEAGIKPDVVAYTIVIKVCVESKNLNQAFSLYEEMRRSHVQPNMVTYSTLLRARSRYGSMHEVQQGLVVYHDMRRAGYKNDYYLKELIEEWCEGVLEDNDQNRCPDSLVGNTNIKTSESLLLEKVGAHLAKSDSESLVIDIQGLTRVEARIIVLVALRMVKEKVAIGKPLEDDMMIILGSKGSCTGRAEVKEAIMELLQKELGLETILAGAQRQPSSIAVLDNESEEWEYFLRRPMDLERLIVTKESLCDWLRG